MFLHDLFSDETIGRVRIHAWMPCTWVTIVQNGKESLHFPRSTRLCLTVRPIHPFSSLSLLIASLFSNSFLFLLKPFLFCNHLFCLNVLWWLVESGNVSRFSHKHFKNKLFPCGLTLPHEFSLLFFFFLQHQTTVAPFVLLNVSVPDSVKSTHYCSQNGGWFALFLIGLHKSY